jgi:hypothetical protein
LLCFALPALLLLPLPDTDDTRVHAGCRRRPPQQQQAPRSILLVLPNEPQHLLLLAVCHDHGQRRAPPVPRVQPLSQEGVAQWQPEQEALPHWRRGGDGERKGERRHRGELNRQKIFAENIFIRLCKDGGSPSVKTGEVCIFAEFFPKHTFLQLYVLFGHRACI